MNNYLRFPLKIVRNCSAVSTALRGQTAEMTLMQLNYFLYAYVKDTFIILNNFLKVLL